MIISPHFTLKMSVSEIKMVILKMKKESQM
jgi:hypothetical protein